MRLLFICSSLERGRDGVGDYTRSLAEECVRLGHSCAQIALHDRHLTEVAASAPTETLPALRLPATLPWGERVVKAAAFARAFRPDTVSLQFVPYGFNDKGLVWNLARHLRPIMGDSRLHIMFHELWIGAHKGASLKETIIGTVQRNLVLRMIRQWQPSAVSTSNDAYIALLKKGGVPAAHLPLFGSIPIVERPEDDWLYARCAAAGIGLTPQNRPDFSIFGMFAALHPIWPPEPLFTVLSKAAAACGRRLIIASAGRLGGGGERLWQQLTETYRGQLSFLRLNEQPVARISDYLQWIDCGIAASPWAVIGKSASAAAMLEHGLPVIVNREDSAFATLEDNPIDPLLMRCDEQLADKLVRGLTKGAKASRLAHTAQQFVSTLQQTEHSALG